MMKIQKTYLFHIEVNEAENTQLQHLQSWKTERGQPQLLTQNSIGNLFLSPITENEIIPRKNWETFVHRVEKGHLDAGIISPSPIHMWFFHLNNRNRQKNKIKKKNKYMFYLKILFNILNRNCIYMKSKIIKQ